MNQIKTELQQYKTQDGKMHIEIMGDGVMDLFGANLEQHAELIVRAVNSLPALVSALEEAKHYLHFDFEASDEVMKRISDALALAKGE